jgi:hypothetical protein
LKPDHPGASFLALLALMCDAHVSDGRFARCRC